MKRGLAALAVVVGSTVSALFVGLSNPASADAPQEQGWWTVTNQSDNLPVAAPVAAPNPPDVPADGLLVQSGPSGPLAPCGCAAIAALVYDLGDGTSPSDLTLKVAPNSASTPVATLELCALTTTTISTEQGGPIGDAPDYDCSKKATASLDAGGTTFKFSVAKLAAGNALAVAILPGDNNTRVVLSKPDNGSLTAAPSTASSGSFDPSTSVPSGAGSTSSGGGGSVADTSTTGGASVPLPAQPPVTGPASGQAPVVAPTPGTSVPAVPLRTSPLASASPAGSGSSPLGIGLLVGGVVAGAALWALAGRAPTAD